MDNLIFLRETLRKLKEVDKYNQQQKLDNFIHTFKIRHNLLHGLLIDTIIRPKASYGEKTASELGLLVGPQYAKLTPDLLLYHDNSLLICDITVQRESNVARENKIKKYTPFLEHLKTLNDIKNGSVISFSIKPDFSNLEFEFEEFKTKFTKTFKNSKLQEFDFLTARLVSADILDVQYVLRVDIDDNDIISRMLEMEFGAIHDNDKMSKKTKEQLMTFDNNYMEKSKHFENYENGVKVCNLECLSQENIENIFSELLDDKEICEVMSEVKTTPQLISSTYEQLCNQNASYNRAEPKPSLHTIYIHDLKPFFPIKLKFKQLEQNQIYTLFYHFSQFSIKPQNKYLNFVKFFAEKFVSTMSNENKDFNITVFENNVIKNQDETSRFKQDYETYRFNCLKSKTPIISFHMFVKKNYKDIKVPTDDDCKSVKQKIFKIPISQMPPEVKDVWLKSHSGHKKEKKLEQAINNDTLDLNLANDMEDFINLISLPCEDPITLQFQDFMSAYNPTDNPTLNVLKENMIDQYVSVYEFLRYAPSLQYSWGQSLVCEQLMHFMQLNLPSNTFSLFTTGNPNMCYIVNNSYHNSGKDVGKSFLAFGVVRDKMLLPNLYGRLDIQEFTVGEQTNYIFATNWRRLTTTKVTFLKDQFYSTLSTSMAFLLRRTEDFENGFTSEAMTAIRHAYSLRVVISLCTNQRVAEMLADMRYAIMGAVSDFSRIDTFLTDKFKPPLKSVVEVWIFTRLVKLAELCTLIKTDPDVVKFKQPRFVGNVRTEDSIGGKIKIPSIWSNYICCDLQDFLDDLFLYVHTIKEPSNIHHENIKALNTILEYQTKYDELPESRQLGNLKTRDEFKNFLLDKNIIGFSHDILQLSISHTLDKTKNVNWNDEWARQKMEPLGDITSTKSVIPEYDRTIYSTVGSNKNTMKLSKENKEHEPAKKHSKKGFLDDKIFEKNLSNALKRQYNLNSYGVKNPIKIKIVKGSNSILQGTNRVKVHDAITDFMERFPKITTTYEGAIWNLLNNNGRVIADICIKAQYGAKREFYVINLGAKMMARMYEQMFNRICKHLPSEMISVSGDKKILTMQEKVNNILSKKKEDTELYFVNGDCTKWSAAETMECFTSMIHAMKGYMPDEMIKFSKDVIACWAKKKITIPTSLLEKTMIVTEKTKYMSDKKIELTSTQNFLQGMWNYSSSFKAVCSTNYTFFLWKKLFPLSNLYLDHLEHSDDYVLMILTNDIEELQTFRRLHRIIMKCHGFNDSIKKTNVQRFLMEFISLCSFNGHMTYPHIKKSKETGLNMGCTGYRDDMDTASSRVGEAVRIGLPFTSSYFMQRVHFYNILRAYSLHPGGTNNFLNFNEMLETPVELFGVPDTHPIFQMLCKGDVNNYRLDAFGKDDIKEMLHTIFSKEILNANSNPFSSDFTSTEDLRMYHPSYIFDQENKLIKKIRQGIGITVDTLNAYWDEHKPYNFIKPKNRKLLFTWLKAMYYRNNFALAYSRSSRAEITLRLSTFVKKPCLLTTDNLIEDKPITIKDFISQFRSNLGWKSNQVVINQCKELIKDEYDKIFNKTLMNCDSTVSSIYSFFTHSAVLFKGYHNKHTIANLTPSKLGWLHVDNPIDSLFQYIFNFEDFLADNRPFLSLASLEADKTKLQKHYNISLDKNTPTTIVKSCYKDLILSKNRKNMCMSYSTKNLSLEDFLRNQIEFGTSNNIRLKLISPGVTEAVNPHTGEFFYKKLFNYTRNEIRLLIDDSMLVFGLLKHGYSIPSIDIKRCLNNLILKDNTKGKTFEEKHQFKSFGQLCQDYDIHQLEELGCKSYELKSFAFLKAFLLDDPSDVKLIMDTQLSYTYSYQPVEKTFQSLGFDEKVEYTYTTNKFTAYHKIKEKTILVITDCDSHTTYTNAYSIALKLFNLITQSRLEAAIGNLSIKDLKIDTLTLENIINTCKLSNPKVFDKDVLNLYRFEDMKSKKDTLIPIIYVENLRHSYKKIKGDIIRKDFSINTDTSTIYVGQHKLYTVPYLSAVQSNISYIPNDFDIGGLKLNWWLEYNRIRDFIHGQKLQVKKDVFDTIDMLDEDLRKVSDILQETRVERLLEELPTENMTVVKSSNNDVQLGESTRVMKELQLYLKDSSYETKYKDNPATLTIPDTLIEPNPELELDFDMSDLKFNLESASEISSQDESCNINMDEFCSDFVVNELSDSDDELMPEVERLEVEEQSSASEENSCDDLISIGNTKQLIPDFAIVDKSVMNVPFSVKAILEKGNPTAYVIRTSYIEEYQIGRLSVDTKLKMLVKLKTLLVNGNKLSMYEKLLVYLLSDSICDSMKRAGFLTWKQNWVVRRVEGKLSLRYLLKNCQDTTLIQRAILKGAEEVYIDGIHHLFIPLPQTRLKPWIDDLKVDDQIDKFMNLNPIKKCYYRLFKVPYQSIIEATDILDEL